MCNSLLLLCGLFFLVFLCYGTAHNTITFFLFILWMRPTQFSLGMMMMFVILLSCILLQIYQPQEVEKVKVVVENVETKTKEYEAAANRLAKTRVVSSSNLTLYSFNMLCWRSFLANRHLTFFFFEIYLENYSLNIKLDLNMSFTLSFISWCCNSK